MRRGPRQASDGDSLTTLPGLVLFGAVVESIRSLLEQAHGCLDAAVGTVDVDAEAALDDMTAARLLVATALISLSVPIVG